MTSASFAIGKPASSGWLILERRYEILKNCMPNENWGEALDIGCGNGEQTALLIRNTSIQTAVDISSEHVQLTKQLLPTIQVVEASAENLPFPDHSFDLITCFEVLEHVKDHNVALREMKRVLKDGGRIAITVPNKWWIFETHGCEMKGHLSRIPWNRIPFLISWLPTSVHEKFARARIYSRKRIQKLVHSCGLAVETKLYVTAPMDVISWQSFKKLLRATLFGRNTTKCPLLAVSHFLLLSK